MTALPFLVSLVLQSGPGYSLVEKIPIGGEGGWDYLSVDSAAHRLYISRGTHVMVLDIKSKKLVGDIPNTSGVHGAAIAAKAGKGYTSNGRDNTVTVFDLKTLKELKRVQVGGRPDAIYFDSASNRVFTFNAGSVDTTAIDVATDTVAGSVKLDGKPEFPQVDGKGSLFVNIEDKSEIQKVDTKALKVVGMWPLSPGEEPSGLAIDTKDGLLFSTCSNNKMTISSTKMMKVVGSPAIGNGPDAAAFDPKLGLAFSSNGQDGTVTVIAKRGGGWDVVQTVQTQKSARTMAIDPATHKVYLIAAEFQAAADPNSRRRAMVPNSAVILVLAPAK